MCIQTSLRNWVIMHKGALHVSPKVSIGLAWIEMGFVTPYDEEISLGPLGNATS